MIKVEFKKITEINDKVLGGCEVFCKAESREVIECELTGLIKTIYQEDPKLLLSCLGMVINDLEVPKHEN